MTEPEDEPSYVIEESALDRSCDLWFATPPGYVEFPFANFLVDPQSSAADDQAESTTALIELAPVDQRQQLRSRLDLTRSLVALMPKEGVIHFSIGAHEGDDGTMLESFLTIARREIPFTPPKLAAAKAATARHSVLPVSMVSLPCGPGAFVEGIIEYPASVDPQRRSVHEITAYLPFPDGRALAVLTLVTAAAEGHEHFRAIHRAVAETISFESPLPEDLRAQIPESEAEASARAAFG